MCNFFIYSIVCCEIFIQNVIHSIIMKFHSFSENVHFIVFEFHSIKKNIQFSTRALIQFKISFNSKKIFVIHSKKLFIFLKIHLSNTLNSKWLLLKFLTVTFYPTLVSVLRNWKWTFLRKWLFCLWLSQLLCVFGPLEEIMRLFSSELKLSGKTRRHRSSCLSLN